MAIEIPTQPGTKLIYSGETGPHASPGSFSPDFSALHEGVTQLGRGLTIAAAAQDAVDRQKKQARDVRWTTDALLQERNHLSEWMVDPQNSSSENFAKKFHDYSLQRMRSYQTKAPSPEADDTFTQHMSDWINRQYATALHITERNRINNGIVSIDTQISDALGSFRNAQKLPNNDPLLDLEDSLHLIHDSIANQFGKTAPETVNRLQAHLVKQAVLGIAAEHPAAASRILNAATSIDEETRKTLSNFIETSQKSRNIVAEDSFSRDRADHVTSVYFGKTAEKIPLEAYTSVYSLDHAQVYKAHDDALIDTYNTANHVVEQVQGKNPAAQMRVLDELHAKASTQQDRAVLEAVTPKFQQNLQRLAKNRVGWLLESNPQLRPLQQQIDSVSDPAQRARLVTQRNELLLRLQGAPSSETPSGEGDFYLNLPSNDRHLLSSPEAELLAAKINQTSPTEAVRVISSILGEHQDTAHQFTVFNDLVTLPEHGKGLRQEYQLAFQNRGAWWLDSYVGALANLKDVARLDDDKRREVLREIEVQPMWKQFQQALIGDGFERANEIEGFKSGIMAFSHALSMSGKPLKEAVKTSVERLIGESLGFAPVNGQYLAISRKSTSGDPRSTDEIQDIGRKLGMSLKYVDPRALDQSHFPKLATLGEPDRVERLQVLRDIVTSRGFFVTANDGQSATLHMRDDNGVPFEMTNTQGVPLRINFNNLPSFTFYGLRQVMPSHNAGTTFGSNTPELMKESPRKTYPLRTGGGLLDKLFGSGQATTNWPTADWIQGNILIPVQQAPAVMPPPAEDLPLTH